MDTISTPGEPESAATLAAPSAGPTGRKLAVLPGNPAFVGGFGGEHPAGAMFGMGDGSVRFMSNNTAGKLLQRFAHRADGQVPNNEF
jgi:hypothetical protein